MTCSNGKYNFSGKVALVTGSSIGIGAAIALQLAQYGAQLTITGRDAENLDKISRKIEEISGKTPLQLTGNLLDESLAPKLIQDTVRNYGKIDYLINNAGAASLNESFDNENLLDQYDQVMGLNVRAVLQLTQLAVPYLEKTKGAIVNISCTASLMPWMLIYSTSKAALDMLTKTSAGQLAPKGICVNSINPGPTLTSNCRILANCANCHQENEKDLKKLTGLGRVGHAEEIANMAVFLLSDQAQCMTGSIVVCDGGMLVRMS